MQALWEILSFRRMISPVIVQILFWAGIGGVLYGTYVLIDLGNWAWPLALVFGCLGVRLILERAIIAFRAHDELVAIRRSLDRRD